MAGTYPAVEVAVAWGVPSSSVPTAGQWVDESAYVDSFDIKHGQQDEFGQPGAGSLDVTFDNASGRFDPDNTSGARHGQLLPLAWVRARGGSSAVTTDVFYGQVSIEGWRLAASQFPSSTVQVTVLDMFEQMANTLLPGSVYTIEVEADIPDVWWRLNEASGTTAFDSSGNGRHGEYVGGATFGSRAGLIANDADNAILLPGLSVADPIYAYLREPVITGTGDFTVEFWWSHSYDQTAEFQPRPIAGAGDDTGGYWMIRSRNTENGLSFLTGDSTGSVVANYTSALNDGEPHHIVCRRTGGTLTIAVDGIVVATTAGSTHSIVAGPTALGLFDPLHPLGGIEDAVFDEFAIYGSSSLSAARIAAHHAAGTEPWASELTSARLTHLLDAAGFPATLRTIATGQTTMPAVDLGGGDLLSAVLDVHKAERSELYVDHHDGGKVRFRDRHDRWTETRSVTSQATFGDGGGSEVPYTSIDIEDDRIVNSATVQRTGGATITATDSASITQYQTRSYSETGLLFEDDAEAESRASLIVAEKKDRHRRVRSVTLEPADPAHPAWGEVFARQIGDRVTVKWRPPYGGTYSFDSWIIGIGRSWRPGDSRPWRTTFNLAPVPYDGVGTTYWILGSSVLGTDTRAGF